MYDDDYSSSKLETVFDNYLSPEIISPVYAIGLAVLKECMYKKYN